MNKLHIKVSEKGKPDFGFDIVTRLRGIELMEAIQKAVKSEQKGQYDTCNRCEKLIAQDLCYCDSYREYYEAASLNR